MSRTTFAFLLAVTVSVFSADLCAEAIVTNDAALEAALKAVRYPISVEQLSGKNNGALPNSGRIDDKRFAGEGWDKLLSLSRQSQFVLIGEDHGFAEVPILTRALYDALEPQRFDTLVVEVGGLSAQRLEATIRAGGLNEQQIVLKRPPFAMPFFNWQEEGDLVTDVASRGTAPTLLGVDQEFILSAGWHFDRLAELATSSAARELAKKYESRDKAAYAELIATRDGDRMFLPTLDASDFRALRKAFDAGPPEATAIIDALAESAAIYRGQQTVPYASNRDRSLLMKRAFMERYAALQRSTAAPHVMFKMGANHVGRGLSPTGQFDLGNLVSEIAESAGQRSVHVLMIVKDGTVNRWMPFLPEDLQHAPYDGHAEFDGLGAKSLLDTAYEDSWTMFDLSALRLSGLPKPVGSNIYSLIHNYDVAIVVNHGTAARLLGGASLVGCGEDSPCRLGSGSEEP